MKIAWIIAGSVCLAWMSAARAETADVAPALEPSPPASAPDAPPPAPVPDAHADLPPEVPSTPPELDSREGGADAEVLAWARTQTPPCQVRALTRHQGQYFLACGEAGLWRVGRTEGQQFVLESREQRGGPVMGFAELEDQVLVLVDLRVAQPLESGEQLVAGIATLTGGSAPKPPDREAWPRGKVIATKGLRITVDLGAEHLVGVGYRVEFRWGEHRVVGRVTRVWGTKAAVMLGMHEPAPPLGTPLTPTPERTSTSIFAPADGDYRLDADVGVRLGLSADGIFGAEAGVQARFGYFAFGGEVRPFVFSTRGTSAAQAFVSVGVSTTWLGLSFGGGTTTVNRHDSNPPGTGILFTPALRVGTIDGLHIRARVSTAFHRQEPHFTGLFLDGQIPVSRAVALVLEGGGGNLGLAEGEAGVRLLLHGNGGHKSWFLRTAFGVTQVSQNENFINAIAPHLHLGVETRL